MAYTKQTWQDNDTTKPLSAARLNYIEQGIFDAHALVALAATDAHGTLAARPAAGTAGRYYTDDGNNTTSRDNGSAWVPLLPQDITTSALPTGVPDGYEVVFYAASSHVWHLRKIGSAWFYLGGGPLYGYEFALVTEGGTYTARNPAITIPRAGLYQVEWGYHALSNAPNTVTYVQSALAGPGLSLAEPVLTATCNSPNIPNAVAMTSEVQLTGSGTLAASYNCAGAGAISSYRRWMRVTPIWVT